MTQETQARDSNANRMACSISDGPQTPEDAHYPSHEDEDDAWDREKARAIDEAQEETV